MTLFTDIIVVLLALGVAFVSLCLLTALPIVQRARTTVFDIFYDEDVRDIRDAERKREQMGRAIER